MTLQEIVNDIKSFSNCCYYPIQDSEGFRELEARAKREERTIEERLSELEARMDAFELRMDNSDDISQEMYMEYQARLEYRREYGE